MAKVIGSESFGIILGIVANLDSPSESAMEEEK